MKKLSVLVLLLSVIVAAGCSKDDTEEASKNPTLTIEKTDYTIAAEGGFLEALFEVNVEWMASVKYVGSDANWLTLNSEYGKAGKVTLTMIAEPNRVTAERKASVRILYGGQMPCVLSVVQSGLAENKDITADFDPLFAQELQKRGYIADAKKITPKEVKGITELDVSGKWGDEGKITFLCGIEYFESLIELNCYDNQLIALDVSKNTALTRLYCDNNQLITLYVSKNTALTYLDCGGNKLPTLDVSKNTALTYLNCGYNPLTTLYVSKNTALTTLKCRCNLMTLDVSKNTALTTLDCYGNQLTMLDVSKNTALTYLDCGYNPLTTLDVSKNTALTYLQCQDNQLTSLDVSKNTALTRLWCFYNQLPVLDVSKNTALTDLSCSNNLLTTLDVSKNMALYMLNCFGNPGNGAVFPVTAWFDNNSIPNNFTTGSWDYNGKTVRIDYRKAE